MKKTMYSLMAVILCSMILASCASSRNFAPITKATLPAVERSDRTDEYQILNTVEAEAVVSITQDGKKRLIKSEGPDAFLNVCIQDKNDPEKYIYSVGDSKGTLRFGIIENFNMGEADKCDAESMARYLAAYRLINEAKTAGADGILAPSFRGDTEEIKNGVVYKIKLSAKLIKLNTAN